MDLKRKSFPPIRKEELPHPEVLDFFFLLVGFTSAFSSSESDKKTFLQRDYIIFVRILKQTHRHMNTERRDTSYFSRAASTLTISFGSIPSLAIDSCVSASSASLALWPFRDGLGVKFWAHFLRRSLSSRTTLNGQNSIKHYILHNLIVYF